MLALNDLEQRALVTERMPHDCQILPYGLTPENGGNGESAPNTATEGGDAAQTLLILGPIHPVEGLVPFLKAFAEIGSDNEGWRIVMGGPEVGDWREMLAAAVRRKGASDRVEFVLSASYEAQRDLLHGASVLACPSLHYRAPVSIMQALAGGVPVLATDRVAPDELSAVADVCSPSRDEFRDALRAALGRSADGRAETASRAREWFRERFDWGVLVDRYVQLYRDLA